MARKFEELEAKMSREAIARSDARYAKLKAPTKRARRSRVAADIISGLKEGVAFARGEISLPVRIVDVRKP